MKETMTADIIPIRSFEAKIQKHRTLTEPPSIPFPFNC